MRLMRLLLHAFGPFTDAEIDFSGHDNPAANLHLIYGPNEAGKSSALRAMTDLRFGVPLRSPDDFIHPSKDLRIAGVFSGADGRPVGLVRRKGRKATLGLFDPAGTDLVSVEEAGAEHVLALSGGLDRDAFEAMFGLNHARLRAGGDRLVKGEGELGSALFEASAGTRGIGAILAALDDDAKALFNPRSKNAAISEARKALDAHRKAWKEAQTRPADWQTLNRAHEQARDALAEVDRELQAAHRRDKELTELRTVAPLLHEYDHALAELGQLADVPELAPDARERRLAAEQALARAQADGQAATAELARCTAVLDGLVIEAPLLAHAENIERLANSLDAVARSRIEAGQQQVTIDQLEAELAVVAARIAPGYAPEDILAKLPSAADRVTLNGHLAQIPRLGDRLEIDRRRAEELGQIATHDVEAAITLPDAMALQVLRTALGDARALGDVAQQAVGLEREIDTLALQLAQVLADIGDDSVTRLRRRRPLLEAQISDARNTLAGFDETARKLSDEMQRLDLDRAQQQLRQRQLAATGEVVTADTLRLARGHRDAGWARVRQAYIERSHDPAVLGPAFDPQRSLPTAFEAAQEDADRQADLLRADAARAAGLEDCAARIEQMAARQREITAQLAQLGDRRQAALDAWAQQLVAADLVALDPDALREWQVARQRALDLAARLERLQTERDRLIARQDLAVATLADALRALDLAPPDAPLIRLIEQAARWESQATELAARYEERATAAKARRAEQQRLAARIAGTETELQTHSAAVADWHARLWLHPGSAAAAVAARLDELDGLARRAGALREVQLRQAQLQVVVADFEQQAADLAQRLGELAPPSAHDYVARLHRRLKESSAREHERQSQMQLAAQAQKIMHNAATEQTKQADLLAHLCADAGVESVAELDGCEQGAAHKRALKARLVSQRQQLARASTRVEAELRERLADQDTVALDGERERCQADIERLDQAQSKFRQAEEQARRALEAIDASDAAARAREAMESAAARYQAAIRPWARLRLAHRLLQEALKRFRERAQAPMIAAASSYFALMTDVRYTRLIADEAHERPVLLAERADGVAIGVEAMSEGTADQLYLALRLAALELRRASHPQMPLVLDDVLITSDDQRAANILQALARFAEGGQVMLFTHHRHVLDLAHAALGEQTFAVHRL